MAYALYQVQNSEIQNIYTINMYSMVILPKACDQAAMILLSLTHLRAIVSIVSVAVVVLHVHPQTQLWQYCGKPTAARYSEQVHSICLSRCQCLGLPTTCVLQLARLKVCRTLIDEQRQSKVGHNQQSYWEAECSFWCLCLLAYER